MDSLQVAGGVLLGHGSFSGSFPVTTLVTHYYHLSRYGFYMKHNVFNQNQVNAGVSSLEPRVTLAAKSSDSVPFLRSAQPRGSHLRHFTNGPSSIHHLLSASSLSCGGNVPLLCALPRVSHPGNASRGQVPAWALQDPLASPVWPLLCLVLLSEQRPQFTVFDLHFFFFFRFYCASIKGKAWAGIAPARNSQ